MWTLMNETQNEIIPYLTTQNFSVTWNFNSSKKNSLLSFRFYGHICVFILHSSLLPCMFPSHSYNNEKLIFHNRPLNVLYIPFDKKEKRNGKAKGHFWVGGNVGEDEFCTQTEKKPLDDKEWTENKQIMTQSCNISYRFLLCWQRQKQIMLSCPLGVRVVGSRSGDVGEGKKRQKCQ